MNKHVNRNYTWNKHSLLIYTTSLKEMPQLIIINLVGYLGNRWPWSSSNKIFHPNYILSKKTIELKTFNSFRSVCNVNLSVIGMYQGIIVYRVTNHIIHKYIYIFNSVYTEIPCGFQTVFVLFLVGLVYVDLI